MLNIKPIEQNKSGLCGVASLRMVLAYYGIKKSEKELAKLTYSTAHYGTRTKSIIRVAKTLGLKTKEKDNATLKDIGHYVLKRKIPVIVDWFSRDDGHYSVVAHINKKYIYLLDPELGKINPIDLATFKRI